MTPILPAVPSLVPRLIWGLADHSDHLLAGYQIAEALYYATLHMRFPSRESQAHKLHRKILAHTRFTQTTFQIADGITVFLCARKIMEQIHKRFPSFASYSAMRWQKIAWTGASAALVCTLAIGLLQTIHRFLPSETTEGDTDRLIYKAKLGFNTQQFSLQVPPMARILLEVALSCLSRNPFWSACSALASTTTLINSLRIRQLSVKAALKFEIRPSDLEANSFTDFPVWEASVLTPYYEPQYSYIAGATVTSLFLSQTHINDACCMCTEPLKDGPTANLCPNEHPLHVECLIQKLSYPRAALKGKLYLFSKEVSGYPKNYYEHYLLTDAPNLRELLPCYHCNTPSLFEPAIENVFIYADLRGGKSAGVASNIITNSPSHAALFSRLCTAYNGVQAALATLYRYPELGESLWSIQKLSLAFDLVEFSHTLYILHQKMKAKIYGTEERKLKFSLVYIAGAASLVALSCLAVKGMGRFLYPHALLKALISTSNPLDIRWDAPRIYFAIQSLAVSRAVASFALSFFSSSYARQNRFSALAHLSTAACLSQLRWLCATQTLQNPLVHAASTGGLISGIHKSSVRRLEMDSFFMIPSSCASQVEHLRSVVDAISNYTLQMFDASHWKFDWSVTTLNGIPGDDIYLGVQLKSRALASCACTLFPKMTDITMKAFVVVTDYFSTLGFRTVSTWVGVSVNDTRWSIRSS